MRDRGTNIFKRQRKKWPHKRTLRVLEFSQITKENGSFEWEKKQRAVNKLTKMAMN